MCGSPQRQWIEIGIPGDGAARFTNGSSELR
jgi:hypothetical protein